MATPKLGLPEITASQSQKEVTHSASLRTLDVLVQLRVIDRHLSAAPSGPSDGDTYIVASPPSSSDDWSLEANATTDDVVFYNNTAWEKAITPLEGIMAYIEDENLFYKFDGANWVSLGF